MYRTSNTQSNAKMEVYGLSVVLHGCQSTKCYSKGSSVPRILDGLKMMLQAGYKWKGTVVPVVIKQITSVHSIFLPMTTLNFAKWNLIHQNPWCFQCGSFFLYPNNGSCHHLSLDAWLDLRHLILMRVELRLYWVVMFTVSMVTCYIEKTTITFSPMYQLVKRW